MPVIRGLVPGQRPRVVSLQDERAETVDRIVLRSFLIHGLQEARIAPQLWAHEAARTQGDGSCAPFWSHHQIPVLWLGGLQRNQRHLHL